MTINWLNSNSIQIAREIIQRKQGQGVPISLTVVEKSLIHLFKFYSMYYFWLTLDSILDSILDPFV